MTMDFTAPKLLSDPGVLEQTGAQGPTFEQVYVQWFHEVSRWARAFGGLDADLDDLTQEVFLVVRRKLPEFDGRNLSGWLYRIAQRTVRDYRRRAWFRALLPKKHEPTTDKEISPPDPAELAERHEAQRMLVQNLAKDGRVAPHRFRSLRDRGLQRRRDRRFRRGARQHGVDTSAPRPQRVRDARGPRP